MRPMVYWSKPPCSLAFTARGPWTRTSCLIFSIAVDHLDASNTCTLISQASDMLHNTRQLDTSWSVQVTLNPPTQRNLSHLTLTTTHYILSVTHHVKNLSPNHAKPTNSTDRISVISTSTVELKFNTQESTITN